MTITTDIEVTTVASETAGGCQCCNRYLPDAATGKVEAHAVVLLRLGRQAAKLCLRCAVKLAGELRDLVPEAS